MSRLLGIVLLLLTLGEPHSLLAVAALVEPTPAPTALANQRPDRCEPNDTVEHACVLALDAIHGPFTFLPEGDQDVYSIDLGPEPGLVLEVTIRTTAGLDVRTTITRAGTTEPLAIISSPVISTTLPSDLSGWLVLRVENRAPHIAAGESYRIEVRRVLPPAAPVMPAVNENSRVLPDRLENNYDPYHAAAIGVGVVYDLTFACPDPRPGACAGGDHDYLAVPVKAGVRYLIATFDLGPGVDTVIDLFWGDTTTPAATNDDARPGASFVSALRWRAPADGVALIRIGPRTGGVTPTVFDDKAGSYRFTVVLEGSDLGRQVAARVAAQTGAGETAGGRAAGGRGATTARTPTATLIPTTDAPQGPAVVQATTTVLREEPGTASGVIQTLQQEDVVALLGQASGAWVRVQPASGVVPGWVYGPDLRALDALTAPASAQATSVAPAQAPALPGGATTPPPTAAPRPSASPTPALPRVQALEPVPLPPATPPAPREPRTVVVTLAAVPEGVQVPTTQPGRPHPTLTQDTVRPLVGVRVQLVTVFGDLLAEALTDANGHVTLTRDLPPATAVVVRVPALGIAADVAVDTPTLTIFVPEGATS
jgi:hypothetical protein